MNSAPGRGHRPGDFSREKARRRRCKRRNYTTTRNKKTQTERVELMKFCPFERKRTLHRETK